MPSLRCYSGCTFLTKRRVPDFLVMAISMAVAMIANIRRVLSRVWPYILVLTTFVRFVLWNGGVVLGRWCQRSSVARIYH